MTAPDGASAAPTSGTEGQVAPSAAAPGPSIAEITAARLAEDWSAATVPFEAGGALHVVEHCGCSDCETAFANSAPVGPAGGEVR